MAAIIECFNNHVEVAVMIFEQCILFEGNMIDAHATLKLNLSVNVEEGWEISVIVD